MILDQEDIKAIAAEVVRQLDIRALARELHRMLYEMNEVRLDAEYLVSLPIEERKKIQRAKWEAQKAEMKRRGKN